VPPFSNIFQVYILFYLIFQFVKNCLNREYESQRTRAGKFRDDSFKSERLVLRTDVLLMLQTSY